MNKLCDKSHKNINEKKGSNIDFYERLQLRRKKLA